MNIRYPFFQNTRHPVQKISRHHSRFIPASGRGLWFILRLLLVAASLGSALAANDRSTQNPVTLSDSDQNGVSEQSRHEAEEESPSAPRWDELSAQQQKRLQRFARQWDQLPPVKRQRMLALSKRWEKMSPQQRNKARHALRRWSTLPPEKRRQLRQRLLAFEHLPPQKRRALIRNWRRFHQLPPEKRRALRKAFEKAAASRHNKSPAAGPTTPQLDDDARAKPADFDH